VVDPFGGSYAIEEMTDRVERDARRTIEALDQQGGVLAAIERGVVQREIQESAYRAQQAIDNGEAVVVGVNRFAGNVDSTAPQIEVFQIDPEIEARQVAGVQAVRASRNEADWRAAIAAVESAARGSDNLVPPILAAVEAHATVGEVADAMRRVFGEHRPSD